MQTLYIASQESFETYLKNSVQQKEGSGINIHTSPDVYTVNTSPIKVSQIRDLISKISSKPIQLSTNYLVIYNFQNTTESAQNAFLKTLEEGNCSIFLHATSKANILETIISRVQINQPNETKVIDKQLVKNLEEIITNKNISAIPTICKNHEPATLYNGLESLFDARISSGNVDEDLIKSYKTLMEVKKANNKVTLNTELQVTNIILGLIH